MGAGAISSQSVLTWQMGQLVLEADNLPPFEKVEGLSPQRVCFDLIITQKESGVSPQAPNASVSLQFIPTNVHMVLYVPEFQLMGFHRAFSVSFFFHSLCRNSLFFYPQAVAY